MNEASKHDIISGIIVLLSFVGGGIIGWVIHKETTKTQIVSIYSANTESMVEQTTSGSGTFASVEPRNPSEMRSFYLRIGRAEPNAFCFVLHIQHAISGNGNISMRPSDSVEVRK